MLLGRVVFNKALDKHFGSLPSRHMTESYFPCPANQAQPSCLLRSRQVTGTRAQFAMFPFLPQHLTTLQMVNVSHR